MVKNLAAMQKMGVRSLDREDPLETGMATHSSILAWRIPRTEEPGIPWGHKELDTTEQQTLPFPSLCICTTSSLSIPLSMTFRLFPCVDYYE